MRKIISIALDYIKFGLLPVSAFAVLEIFHQVVTAQISWQLLPLLPFVVIFVFKIVIPVIQKEKIRF